MSNAFAHNLKVEQVLNSKLDFEGNGRFGVDVGPVNFTPSLYPTEQYNQGVVNFNIPPQNPLTAMDRMVIIEWNFIVTVTATATGANQYPLNMGVFDAPRQFPGAQITTGFSAQINNSGPALQTNFVINELLTCNQWIDETGRLLSGTPSFPDQFQDYQDVFNNPQRDGWGGVNIGPSGVSGPAMSPFAAYGVGGISKLSPPRGSWPIIPLTDQASFNIMANRGDTRTFSFGFKSYEPLIIQPFGFVADRYSLIGLNTFTINATTANLNRAWSRPTNGTVAGMPDWNMTIALSQPKVHINWLTPPPSLEIPQALLIPYSDFTVNTYPINGSAPVAALSSFGFNASATQLSAVPKRILVFIKKTQPTFNDADVWARIDSLQVTFDNRATLLGTADSFDLWRESADNGLQMSWPEWNIRGSVMILDITNNLTLSEPTDAPGVSTNKQLSIQGTATNLNSRSALPLTLFIVLIYNGIMTIQSGTSVTQTTPLTEMNVVQALNESSALLSGPTNYTGGSLPKSVRKVFGAVKEVAKGAHNAHKFLKKHNAITKGLNAFDVISNLPEAGLREAVKQLGYGLIPNRKAVTHHRGGALATKTSLKRTAYQKDEEDEEDNDNTNVYEQD